MLAMETLITEIERRGCAPHLGAAGAGYSIEQNSRELAEFVLFCEAQGVKTFLELGTGASGGLARFLAEYVGWQVTAVDVRIPRFYPQDGVEFIHASTIDALAQLQGRTFDAVLIDADKSWSGLDRDHAAYAPLATKIVAIHDIAPDRECCYEAMHWWALFKSNTAHHTYEAIAASLPIGIGWYTVCA